MAAATARASGMIPSSVMDQVVIPRGLACSLVLRIIAFPLFRNWSTGASTYVYLRELLPPHYAVCPEESVWLA